MTDPSFDRRFTAWLDERVQPHAPTGLAADIVERTARSRPRPAWRIPERWFTMPTSIRLALIPRGLLLLFALWLIVSLTVAGAAIGGRLTFTQAVLPPPVTGPAANGLIAFERESDIYVVEPDGSAERPLVAGPALEGGPSWSPDGTRIAYQSSAAEGAPTDLMVANADGTGAITVGTVPGIADLDWSLDGTRIAFVTSATEDEPPEVMVANADGTGAITVASGDHGVEGWSPDGATLLLDGTDPTG